MAAKKADSEVAVLDPVALPTVSKRQDNSARVTDLGELRTFIGQEVDWADIEPRFDVVSQSDFEDYPLVIGGFRFNDSTKYMAPDPVNPEVLIPARFVSLMIAGYDPESEKFTTPWVIVNDGSTGIQKQLTNYISSVTNDDAMLMSREELNRHCNKVPPIKAERGFRKSEYPYTAPDGKVSTATTWYIA